MTISEPEGIFIMLFLVDDGLPAVPSITVQISPNYPQISPECMLNSFHNSNKQFIKDVGKAVSNQLSLCQHSFSLSFILQTLEDAVFERTAKALMNKEDQLY